MIHSRGEAIRLIDDGVDVLGRRSPDHVRRPGALTPGGRQGRGGRLSGKLIRINSSSSFSYPGSIYKTSLALVVQTLGR